MTGVPTSGAGGGPVPRRGSLAPSTAVAEPEEREQEQFDAEEDDAPERRLRQKRSGRRGPSGRSIESGFVWLLFAAVYFVIGYRVVVDLNVVNFDSLSRMAHAYFVWYNDPPKLAAIGFVWPPVQTIIYLPFVLIKPLATSLAALPASSAAFMAATMVMINLGFRAAQMRWFLRWPLLLAFGLNPMIVYYGANGMAEAVYLFFLTFAVYFLIRWRQTHHNHLLAFVGFGIAIAMLSRYEVVPFGALLAAGITLVILTTWGKRERARSLESGLVLYLAPVIYFGMAWLFFNWLILGDPLYFLAFGATTADVATSQQDVAGVAARDLGPAGVVTYLTKLNIALFPLTVAMVPALLVTSIVRRSPLSLVLAALVATNAVVTGLLFLQNGDPNLLQLRYNMRAMPLAVLGAAWLFYVWRPAWRPGATGAATPGKRRRAGAASLTIWAATLLLLLAGLPMVWKTMSTYGYQYEENVFLRALVTGNDQEGNTGIGGYPIGIADEKEMATYITDEIPEDAVILTDDAQSLGVMVLTGHPDRFFDRIDKGDGPWNVALDNPWGNVDYFLVSTNERCRLPCVDLIREQWSGVLQGQVPGMEVVFSTDRTALISIAPEPPGPNAVAPADREQAQGAKGAGGDGSGAAGTGNGGAG